ncbi:site-2 protease family protein [Oricola thermophila]|uniref:Site-2 protease family protein n=1 Tax=Oricola thermophila TaxID=2742145 RepID=A0A6N1VA12_9HYPH|nr:site-2 protease family protein [Oricola thermophila]QKV17776.1 site-2 protease family protein [Oricola thermophila]
MSPVFALLVGICLVLWLVMSAPVGRRTVGRSVTVRSTPERLWAALHPFGAHFSWNGAVTEVIRTGPTTGHMVTSHAGRDGQPIRRDFEIVDEVPGESFTMRFTNDTSLAQSFWENHEMRFRVEDAGDGQAVARLAETDRYRGVAFLVFRFFALRRQARKLKRWAETGEFRPGGVFEHPLTQFGMAGVSAMLIWPFFGLDGRGLFLAVTLTVVVAAHEFGHMVAFRLMGHRSARMIFLPLLGGIAMGGRPYDRHFEIGFSALMGAGFSAFPVALLTCTAVSAPELAAPVPFAAVTTIVLVASMFNLGNLMPVWKFDGGQVLRQLFRSNAGMAGGAFAMLALMAAACGAAGLSWRVILVASAVLTLLSVMTAKTGVKPKTALTPMNDVERIALGLGLVATLAIHAFAMVWSFRALF